MEFLGGLSDAWDFAEAASRDTEDKRRKRCSVNRVHTGELELNSMTSQDYFTVFKD